MKIFALCAGPMAWTKPNLDQIHHKAQVERFWNNAKFLRQTSPAGYSFAPPQLPNNSQNAFQIKLGK